MHSIDLALAVNYIPACSCTLRVLVFLLWLSVLSVYENKQYFVILGIVLYLDRIVHRSMHIFDSNAILCTVFFCLVFQDMRRFSDELNFTVLVVYFVWGVVALMWQWDRGMLVQWMQLIPFSQYLVEAHLTALVMFYLLYHKMQVEPYGCVVGKSLVFDILVIAWIYIVGIKQSHITSVHINTKWMVRFLPILILPLWMSVLFSVASLCILVWVFRQTFHVVTSEKMVLGTVNTFVQSKSEMPTIVEESLEDSEDIEAMFRLAKQASIR